MSSLTYKKIQEKNNITIVPNGVNYKLAGYNVIIKTN